MRTKLFAATLLGICFAVPALTSGTPVQTDVACGAASCCLPGADCCNPPQECCFTGDCAGLPCCAACGACAPQQTK